MGIARTIRVTLAALTLITAAKPLVFAQSDSGRLQGVITDQSNALVPGVRINLKGVSTNRVLETTSAEDTFAW